MPIQYNLGPLPGGSEADGDRAESQHPDSTIPRPTPAAPDHAAEYHRRGWRIVPVPAGKKAPVISGWPGFEAKVADLPGLFGRGENIGIILGAASGDLVDIDLDCPEALALADLYLPPTRGVFGRASKPRSHRLFVAPGAVYESFVDPLTGATLIELRAGGRDGGAHQTIFPPSITDGEHREWCGDTVAPAVIEAVALRTAVAWLAIGALTMRHVSETAAGNPCADLPNLLWEADPALGRRAFDWLGLPHPDAPRPYPRPRREISQAELDLAELVAEVPNHCDWHEWNAIGLAIFAVDSSDHGLTVFDDFSAKSPKKYDPDSVQERWRNYRRSPPNRTGIGKLMALALAAGWRPPGRRRATQ
jgi:Bifunctional DNA primase/polymerase, N-terminal/Primase C terminal 2 (PriCT-2)